MEDWIKCQISPLVGYRQILCTVDNAMRKTFNIFQQTNNFYNMLTEHMLRQLLIHVQTIPRATITVSMCPLMDSISHVLKCVLAPN